MKTIRILTAALVAAIIACSCAVPALAAESDENFRKAVAGLAVGDVDKNGTININDATMIQKIVASLITADFREALLSDVNNDDKVSIDDVTAVQKITAGLIPTLSGKKGIDISSSNGDVDLNAVKEAGYEFVMLRCGFGDDLENQDDARFESNVRKCEELGLPWGVYFYSYALDLNGAKSEVEHVLRLLNGKKPTLPIAFDMEDGDGYKQKAGMPSNKMLVDICRTFIEGIREAGYYPILYTGLDWIEDKLNDRELLESCDIWFAQWNAECQYEGTNLGMWQYGGEVNYLESETIDGVGVIDKNVCFRDYPDIIKKGHYNGW